MEEYFEANRNARFRGVFCDHARPEATFTGLNLHTASNENVPLVKAGIQFLATSARGPTGAFSIASLTKPGPILANEPIIHGHSAPVTDLAWSPFDDMLLASASVDTVINLWKVPKKGLTSDVTDSLVALTGHTDAVNVIEFHPTTGRLILSASKDGTVKLWDIEHKTALYSAESLANVTGISWNDLGSEFLLSSSTENAKIHDARNKNGITATLANTIGHKSMFLGGTDMIMALDSHNASIRLWDYRKSCAELATIDLPINPSHTLPPCYDADVKLLYLVDKSNRLFTVFDVGVKDTYLMTRQTFKSKNHGKAICMIPKRATNIGGCEISRIMKLTTDMIEPISFSVPRILDTFQEDLYPHTFAHVESQTKQEWWEHNSNLPPVLRGLEKEYAESLKSNSNLLAPREAQDEVNDLDDVEDDGDDDEDQIPIKIIQGTPFLKFGRRGVAHEKMLRIQEGRYVVWDSSWFSGKFGQKCMVDLEKALRIQRGQMTTKFDRESKYYGAAKDTAFSVIYIEKREEKSIDFIAQSKEDFDLWFNQIEKILRNIRITREATALTARFLKFTFEQADIDKNAILSNSEIRKLVADLSINSSREDVQTVFNQVSNSDHLNIDEFANFVYSLRRRFDLELLWGHVIQGTVPEAVTALNVSKDSTITSPFPYKDAQVGMPAFIDFWKKTTAPMSTGPEEGARISKEVETIFKTFKGPDFDDKDPHLSYEGFFKLMNSETNDVYDPASKRLNQDMTHPLSYYYMYSSHNTYLESDQLIGKSSVNRYINDLLRGVRCVELDTWNGPDGDPIIKHGGTLTSTILFLDVIKAIKTFAFVVSPYPVVLSIENHCNHQQQRRMAIMMRGIFGDMLLDANEGYYSRSDILLESPEELREKILVKGSRPRAGAPEEDEDDEDDFDEDDEDASQDGEAPGSISHRQAVDSMRTDEEGVSYDESSNADDNTLHDFDDETIESSSVTSAVSAPSGKKKKAKRSMKKQDSTLSSVSKGSMVSKTSSASKKSASAASSTSDALSSINQVIGLSKEKTHEFLASITYIATCKIKSFEPKIIRMIPADHISSFRESTMAKHSKKHLREWIEHNKTHLSRIYPEGTRVDSSNYDPVPAWTVGAQLIALNTQTHDVPNILNDGMFRQNGGCGYVLKPEYMLFDNGGARDPPCLLRINIISGQSFPKLKGMSGNPNPHVELSVNGLDEDTTRYTTTTVQNNGFDPIWDESFEFTVKITDLAQLTFQVINDKSWLSLDTIKVPSIASGSIPLKCIRPGFRIVRLYDENGRNDFEFAFATLFVHITKEALPSSKDKSMKGFL